MTFLNLVEWISQVANDRKRRRGDSTPRKKNCTPVRRAAVSVRSFAASSCERGSDRAPSQGLLMRYAGAFEDRAYELFRRAPHGAVALPLQDHCTAARNRVAHPQRPLSKFRR